MSEETKGIFIPLEWEDCSRVETKYANQLYVTHSGPEFYLIFGEIIPPMILTRDPEDETIPESLKIKPVAKIAATPEVMTAMVEAINQNIEKFKSKHPDSED